MTVDNDNAYKYCKCCGNIMFKKEYIKNNKYVKWRNKIFCNDECRKKYRKQLMDETYNNKIPLITNDSGH
jgi:hypothetical protein